MAIKTRTQKRLTRPLYEGGQRCDLRHYILREFVVGTDVVVWPPKAISTDCHCIRDPHDDHVHECVCSKRWVA